jgi:hypothetical protein
MKISNIFNWSSWSFWRFQRLWNGNAELSGYFAVDYNLRLGYVHNRDAGRIFAAQYSRRHFTGHASARSPANADSGQGATVDEFRIV